jgi:hypothetical protein
MSKLPPTEPENVREKVTKNVRGTTTNGQFPGRYASPIASRLLKMANGCFQAIRRQFLSMKIWREPWLTQIDLMVRLRRATYDAPAYGHAYQVATINA